MIRLKDDKFYDTMWLFEITYSGILPCPNCRVSMEAYLQSTLNKPYAYKRPRVIFLEFGRSRDATAVLRNISDKLVGEQYMTPTFYHYGTAFATRRDVSQYKALLETAMGDV